MQRLCKSCGKWHDLDQPWPDKCFGGRRGGGMSDAAPYVISDNMEPAKHHATGKIISSKREFSRETRAAGCVELGNEPIRPRKPVLLDKRERREAVKRAIYQLRNRS